MNHGFNYQPIAHSDYVMIKCWGCGNEQLADYGRIPNACPSCKLALKLFEPQTYTKPVDSLGQPIEAYDSPELDSTIASA